MDVESPIIHLHGSTRNFYDIASRRFVRHIGKHCDHILNWIAAQFFSKCYPKSIHCSFFFYSYTFTKSLDNWKNIWATFKNISCQNISKIVLSGHTEYETTLTKCFQFSADFEACLLIVPLSLSLVFIVRL